MALTRKEVEEIAHLTRLNLTPEELAQFGSQLESILGYVEKLNELRLDGIEPTAHVLPLTDRGRADEVKPGLSPEDVEASAADSRAGSVRVPRILEE